MGRFIGALARCTEQDQGALTSDDPGAPDCGAGTPRSRDSGGESTKNVSIFVH